MPPRYQAGYRPAHENPVRLIVLVPTLPG